MEPKSPFWTHRQKICIGRQAQQIEDTKVNGEYVSGTHERVRALGPGAVYSFSKEDDVFANLYSEFGAENRPEGTKLIFRFVHQL
jgi:anthranilate 1,2-dioxygenase (deaminating, decarboxylating) large subunit